MLRVDDENRVQLQRLGIDYINASYVHVPEAERSFILTQVIFEQFIYPNHFIVILSIFIFIIIGSGIIQIYNWPSRCTSNGPWQFCIYTAIRWTWLKTSLVTTQLIVSYYFRDLFKTLIYIGLNSAAYIYILGSAFQYSKPLLGDDMGE